MLILAITDLRQLLKVADITAAMSVEGLLGSDSVFAGDLHELRRQPGQALTAANIRTLMKNSPIRESHGRLPALGSKTLTRCAAHHRSPEAPRDTVDHAATIAGYELRAAIDNPLVTSDGRVESNGNFHGAPLAYVLDFLGHCRRRPRPASPNGGPTGSSTRRVTTASIRSWPRSPGIESGHMIAQYTQAAIVSELKRLATPASVDSIPSSAMQEDHVSMGWSAARKLRRAIDGLTRVLAIELLTAARGIELRAPLQPAPATGAVISALRRAGVPGPGSDRELSPEIEIAVSFVADGSALAAAESVTGALH